MLEIIYKKNLDDNMPDLSRLDLPDFVRSCRELMGLKQYACSEYLGFEESRYKKLELGKLSEPLEEWEVNRLQTFFFIPDGTIKKKQREFLNRDIKDRMRSGKSIWNATPATVGERNTRSEGKYKRVKGVL